MKWDVFADVELKYYLGVIIASSEEEALKTAQATPVNYPGAVCVKEHRPKDVA